MNEEIKKKVDESWKDHAFSDDQSKPTTETESKNSSSGDAPDSSMGELPPANFISFVTSLGMQAFMQLGLMPEAQSGKTIKDLKHAQYLIDTLVVLEEKTRGNLEDAEKKALDQLLYELRIKFVEASK